ncbi:MAG TPA: BMP family ABC transporter substrate-binding protein [Ktedonobacterales bacterium]|nr:BMP family ABC transporter substrate-binding protein [Ktedonobacterales bacterium]
MSGKRAQIFGVVVSALMLISVLAGCGSSSKAGTGSGTTTPTTKIKVGLVTDIGGLNDRGFNHLADLGLTNAVSQLHIQGDVKESHSGDDYIPNLTNFAQQKYDLVIAVGFLMATAVGTVSGQFTNTHFAIIDGAGTDANGNDLHHPNVQSLVFSEQDAGALVGVVAGMIEKAGQGPLKKNIISAVGGISIPPVNHYIAGYKWAATMEDPGVTVKVGYSNDFTDPAKCQDVAHAQISAGADIVFQVAGGCGLGAIQAATQAHVYSIGVDTDQKDAGPSVIASAEKRVDTATFDAIKSVVNNQFQGGVTLFDLKNGGVGIAPGNLGDNATIDAEVTKVSQEIVSGQLTPPATIP